MPQDERAIRRLEEIRVYDNRYLELHDDLVEFPGGVEGRYVRLSWKDSPSVAVVPVTERGTIFLVRQFCYAADAFLVQIPKGFSHPGLSPIDSARAELSEELGATSEGLEYLISLKPDPSLIENPLEVFLARGVRFSQAPSPEPTELIDRPIEIDPARFEDEIAQHRIVDAATIASVFLARAAIHAG